MDLLRLLRPKQWIKNLFVIAPLLFSKRLFLLPDLVHSFIMFLLFCCASSAIYIMNDIKDAPLDRLHPTKRGRPIASGRVSGRVSARLGYLLFTVLLVISFVGSLFLPWNAFVCLLTYVLLNVFYTFKGKEIVLMDVFCIAVGFALRVMAGSYVLNLSPSAWLISSTFFSFPFSGIQ